MTASGEPHDNWGTIVLRWLWSLGLWAYVVLVLAVLGLFLVIIVLHAALYQR